MTFFLGMWPQNTSVAQFREELYAIGDDVDDIATELNLSTLHKIKLKALLKKLPPLNGTYQLFISFRFL